MKTEDFSLADFQLTGDDFRFIASDLQRPETVMALSDGSVLSADKRGAVIQTRPDGAQCLVGTGIELSNSFALDEDGQLLVADLARGAIMHIDRGGCTRLLHDTYGGQPLGAVNFIMAGEEPGVFWVSVSSRDVDYRKAIEQPVADGRIFRLDAYGLTLVADGLMFPNAMQIDPVRGYFHVVETTAGALSRAPIEKNGMPGAFERFGPEPLFEGAYPDGLALDCAGNVWLTELSRNAIFVVDSDGHSRCVFEDRLARVLNKPTGLAFGGSDLRTVYVGSLKMASLPSFRAPLPGLANSGWRQRTRLAVPVAG